MNRSQSNIPSLFQRYKNYFPIGAAVSPKVLHTHEDLIIKHFNCLTCENHMKPIMVQPHEGVFTFEMADTIVDFAMANNMYMRGHTLVWHNQTPNWFFEDDGQPAGGDLILTRLKKHIETVMKRYKGKVYCWDVVNEAILDGSDGYLRDTKWLSHLGEDYIAKAFQFAHEADEEALLFYNDYNAVIPEKRDKIFRLLKDLKDKDAPVHGMGIQGHWNIYSFSLDDIKAAIEMYASLDLEIQITELDISMYNWNDASGLEAPTEEMIARQDEKYEEIFKLFREYSDVITGVTLWGAADDVTWLDNFPVRGRKNWPLLFDVNQQPKGAFWRVIDFQW